MADYASFTDAQLLSLLHESDNDAFSEIYERYHSLLYIYAHKKLNHKQEAQDIVQEVLTTLWTKRETIHIETSLPTYLYTATRNKALDLFAHQKVEAKYIESLQAYLDSGIQADSLARENSLKALIEREIDALPPRMREVFILSRRKQMTHKQIAEQLDISEQTVSTQIKKALKVLRLRLGIIAWIMLLLYR